MNRADMTTQGPWLYTQFAIIAAAVALWWFGWFGVPPAPFEAFFVSMETWPVSKAIGESLWIYPLVQALHLVAMAFFMGAVMLVNLRLMGLGLTGTPLAQVARSAGPWIIGGLVAMFLTGLPQLMQNSSREYYSEYFWRKMSFLLVSLIMLTISMRFMKRQSDSAAAATGFKFVGVAALVFWANVIIAARLIGLFT